MLPPGEHSQVHKVNGNSAATTATPKPCSSAPDVGLRAQNRVPSPLHRHTHTHTQSIYIYIYLSLSLSPSVSLSHSLSHSPSPTCMPAPTQLKTSIRQLHCVHPSPIRREREPLEALHKLLQSPRSIKPLLSLLGLL